MGDTLDLERALVIGVASSALFDLSESDAVFREEGEERYRAYQRENLDEVLEPGVSFPFIRRLLDLNDLSEDERWLKWSSCRATTRRRECASCDRSSTTG